MSACLPIVVSPGKCRDLSVSAFSFIRRHVNADLHLPIHADAGRKRSCKPLSLRWLEYQTMRRRYQLGGSVVSAASLISPPRSFAVDVRAYMEIYTSISRNQDIYKTFLLMRQFLESPSLIHASLRKTFPHQGRFRTTQRAYGSIEYQHQCGIEFVERCLACCCNHNIV